MLARTSLGKDSSEQLKAAQASKAEAQPPFLKQEPLLDEYTTSKLSWSIGSVAISAPTADNDNRRGGSRTPASAIRMEEPPGPTLAKLEVGAVDDPLEREAQRIGDQVIRTPRDVGVGMVNHPRDSHPANGSSGGEVPPDVYQALRSPGTSLSDGERDFFETRFGHDFSQVRVHADPSARKSADNLSARAYTAGQHIVLGSANPVRGAEYAGLIGHELTHVVQQCSRTDVGVVRRSPGPPRPAPPSPPEWLGTGATHLQGDVWEVQIRSLGRSPVGPYDQLQSYLRTFNQNRPPNVERMEAAHIVGGEHMRDLGWEMPYEKAPCIGVAKSLHDKWTREISNLQSQAGPMGGRATKTVGRPTVGPKDVKALYDEVYRGIPELKGISDSIVDREGKRIMGAKYGMPAPKSPMDVHAGGMPKPKSPMDVHRGEMPKPKSPMDVHQGEMPKPKSPMDVHQSGIPERIPETVPEMGVPSAPSIGKSVVKLALTEIALNVLLFAVTYYLDKWHAEKQARKFNNDLKGLWPEINTGLKNKETEIMDKAKAFPLVYSNISIVYTHDHYAPEDYNEGSMRIRNVAISHQKYQTPETLMEQKDPLRMDDPPYLLTFSVPLFEEETAEKGASSLVRNYRQVRESLTYPAFKVRLSAAITLYKLAKQDSSLLTLVTRDLLGMLKDEDATVRLAAAVFLSRLKAKIAIQYIRELIPITSDDKHKELIQRYLRELEQ